MIDFIDRPTRIWTRPDQVIGVAFNVTTRCLMLSLTCEYQASAFVGIREVMMQISDQEGNIKSLVQIGEPIANEVTRYSWALGTTYTVTNNAVSQAMPYMPLEVGDLVSIIDDQAIDPADVLVNIAANIILL